MPKFTDLVFSCFSLLVPHASARKWHARELSPPPIETQLVRDQRLLDSIGRGDMAAFEELYALHRDRLFALALRFTNTRQDAEDVLQETFAYLLSKLPGLQLRARLSTLLYPAIKNLASAARRKTSRFASDSGALELQACVTEFPVGDDREELARVLAGLSVEKREVLLLRVVDDLSMEEIAIALEVPQGTVKSRLHHALQWLREDPGTRQHFEKDLN